MIGRIAVITCFVCATINFSLALVSIVRGSDTWVVSVPCFFHCLVLGILTLGILNLNGE